MEPINFPIGLIQCVNLFSLRHMSSPYGLLFAFANAPEENDVGGGPLWGSQRRFIDCEAVKRCYRRADLAWMTENRELAGLGVAQRLAPRPVTIVLRDGHGR